MSQLRVRRDHPHRPEQVWRAITDPSLMALWTMRPEGFAPVPGIRFTLVANPLAGWRGWVD